VTEEAKRLRFLIWEAERWVARMEAAWPEPTYSQRISIQRGKAYIKRLQQAVAEREKEQA
jgi:hypothetical protein